MADLTLTPVPPAVRGKNAASKPTFLRALRGIWLFTWRSQLTWRRVPLRAAGLLALPFLVYITTSSPQAWSKRQSLLGNPAMQFNNLSQRLARAGHPLKSEQRTSVLRIFCDEYASVENEGRDTASEETDPDRQSRQIKACYDRIDDRVKPILDDRQFAEFQSFKERDVLFRQNRGKEPAWNWSSPFYHWLVDLYFFIILPLSCVRACGALIRDELQADTLGFLTTRPLSRARLLAAKYLSQTAWLQITFLVETLLLFASGSLRHIPALGSLMPLFLAAQLLAVPAWCALGTFLGLVARRYIAIALLYGLIVEMGIGRIPTNINTLSLMRHLKTLLAHNAALQGLYEWSGAGVPLSVGALLLASGVFLTLAALLFTFVEYHHTAEMQK